MSSHYSKLGLAFITKLFVPPDHARELADKKGKFFYTKYFSLYLLRLYRKLPNLP